MFIAADTITTWRHCLDIFASDRSWRLAIISWRCFDSLRLWHWLLRLEITRWRCFDSLTIWFDHLLMLLWLIDDTIHTSDDDANWVTQCHCSDMLVSNQRHRCVNTQFALRWAFDQHLINECLIIVPFLNDSVIYDQWQIKTFRNGHPLFTRCMTYTNSWCQEVHSGMISSCK